MRAYLAPQKHEIHFYCNEIHSGARNGAAKYIHRRAAPFHALLPPFDPPHRPFPCPAAARIGRLSSLFRHKKRARHLPSSPRILEPIFWGNACPRTADSVFALPACRAGVIKVRRTQGPKSEKLFCLTWLRGQEAVPPFLTRPRRGAAAAALCAYAKALRVYFNALFLLKIQIDMLERRHLAHVAGDARVVV